MAPERRCQFLADVDIAAAIDEVMVDTRERLAEEARRSAVFGKSGWMSFITGALGGAIAGVAGGAPWAAAGAAGAVASDVARRALAAPRAETAESRHYVLFRRDLS